MVGAWEEGGEERGMNPPLKGFGDERDERSMVLLKPPAAAIAAFFLLSSSSLKLLEATSLGLQLGFVVLLGWAWLTCYFWQGPITYLKRNYDKLVNYSNKL